MACLVGRPSLVSLRIFAFIVFLPVPFFSGIGYSPGGFVLWLDCHR